MFFEKLESRQLMSGTAYYVSPTGNDPALPAGAAQLNLAQVNATNFLPGDSILFQENSTFNGGLVFNASDVGGDGKTSSPIVINTYDTSSGTLLIGAGKATLSAGNGNGILATNTAGFQISNLIITGSGQANNSYNGISFDNNLAGNKQLPYVHIDSVMVSGFGKFGITIGGSNGKSGFSDVSITNTVSHDNIVGGIETHGVFSGSATTYANGGVTLAYDTVYNNTGYANSSNHVGDGIVLSDVQGGTIDHCVAYNNGQANTHNGGPVGIWAWDSDSITIQYCQSYSNHTNSSSDGDGFDFDGGVTNSLMQYNYSHDNDGCGYGIFEFKGARAYHNNVYRYNISVNDGRKNGYAGFQMWSGSSSGIQNVQVYNNTVYMSAVTSKPTKTIVNPTGAVYLQTATCTNVNFRNNIFTASGAMNLYTADSGSKGVVFQRNDWFNYTNTLSFKQGATVYTSLTSWATAAKQEENPIGNSKSIIGLSIDPGFVVNPSVQGVSDASGFKLQATSPLIDTAWNLASLFGGTNSADGATAYFNNNYDFGNQSIPSNGKYDLGAWEYQS